MQKFILLFIIVLSSAFVLNAQTKPAVKKPVKKQVSKVTPPVQKQSLTKMTFDQERINIGKMKKGEIKKFDFVFTNTGTEVIEIDIVSGCVCTTLDWTRGKIQPGKKGIINVQFDSGKKEDHENNSDVDVYLKNINPKTEQRILKILNFQYEIL
jgi:hypothetical protein